MISRIDKNSIRQKRHQRTRRHILGTAERPRLNVYRSLNHIYAQVIDDDASPVSYTHLTLPILWLPLPLWMRKSRPSLKARPRAKLPR